MPVQGVFMNATANLYMEYDEVSRDALHTSPLLRVPDEIVLEILSYLNVSEILSCRKTCTGMYDLTHDRSIWLALLQFQRYHLPLPPPFAHDRPDAALQLSDAELENLVLSADHTDHTWLHQRLPVSLDAGVGPSISKFDDENGGSKTILTMDIFLDRWLLCVYYERLVQLWDLQPDGMLPKDARHDRAPASKAMCYINNKVTGAGLLSSSRACLDEGKSTLFVAVTSHSECAFISVRLHSSSTPATARNKFDFLGTLSMPTPMLLLRALHAAGTLALLSYSDSYVLIDWGSQKRWILDTSQQGEEELWNGTIAARFITSRHILCVKVHSVELLVLPDPLSSSHSISAASSLSASIGADRSDMLICVQIIAHPLDCTTFRGSSISAPHIVSDTLSSSSWDSTRATVSFLAYDVLRGLFHYRVSLVLPAPFDATAPPSDCPPAHMSVRLVSAHHMALPVHRALGAGNTSVPVPRSGFTPGSRGFVSACALGPTGRRGVWVERKRGNTGRSVIGFSAAPESWDDSEDCQEVEGQATVLQGHVLHPQEDIEEVGEGSQAIDGSTIYAVSSFDLRDDITVCALSEATGRVVLGTRKGEVQLL